MYYLRLKTGVLLLFFFFCFLHSVKLLIVKVSYMEMCLISNLSVKCVLLVTYQSLLLSDFQRYETSQMEKENASLKESGSC